jgi:hypothetical protein
MRLSARGRSGPGITSADPVGVRQPRIAAIERSRNVTFDVLERYVAAVGGRIELTVVQGGERTALISGRSTARAAKTSAAKPAAKGMTTRKTSVAKASAATKLPAKSATKRARVAKMSAPGTNTPRKTGPKPRG